MAFCSPAFVAESKNSEIPLEPSLNLSISKSKYKSMFWVLEYLKSDFKSFPVGDDKIAIGQVFTLDVDRIFDELDSYLEKLEEINKKEGYKFIVLAITDILKNGSYIIYTEDAKKVLENIYSLDDIKQTYFVDGLVSRKKQILPAILEELN